MESLVRARHARSGQAALERASATLDLLRLQVRLLKDLRLWSLDPST